ncbi:lipase [Shewanella sp. Choline-02u-19]|jgi:Pla-1/cef family extracellular lipase|uniref:VolA/Pla-1 family phospholipase n=1 Tax=unclassified Shewanella TaxID=196818 RepID=UPI000C3324B5|nr:MULTISPECIES: VolA/Pla-1 family phospholipase [unclassified Shewanella]PKG58853.1 lipase [Shewanella sp. GutDb-MelDb]PKG74165.1 lipase [Shewanella sp. GutCb]PKH55825.1 lipase [Shewanella sp. Bg11-22]PKI27188.1 lipase [Shewanella sp. Choline-02u-19]
MKKLFLGVAIASALGLTGCSEDSYNELVDKTEPLVPQSVLVFDPANKEVPLPNDLLFSGTLDGTLEIPGEDSGDYTDPQIALGALDGWSTSSPISIKVAPSTDSEGNVLTIDGASVAQPGAVRMFEATVGGALSSDPECKAAVSVSACKVGAELQFGVDFVSTASGNSIAIVPLKPLKHGQSYIYATTTLIQDSAGRAIAPSSTYGLLKLDIETKPLETPDQLMLQTLVNSYEKGMAAAGGPDADTVTYSGLFTTQSISNVYETTKLLMIDPTPGNPYAPALTAMPAPAGYTVAMAAGLTPADGLAYVVSDLADVFKAELKVPIYGDCSSAGCLDADFNPTINGSWKALGDSPVSVLLAMSNGTLSQTNYGMQAVAYGIDPAAGVANPALLVGKAWFLNDGVTPTDSTKHLTKFNPIPAIKGYENISVQITLPNAAKLAGFYQQQGLPFTPPTNGWPTTIAMHGLGGGKEMALAYAGTYAASGIATIAIDMPLHGARSFDANGDGIYEISATDPSFGDVVGTPDAFKNGNPLVFVNIASTLTVRDNFRQATVDHLALRAALTGLYLGIAQQNGQQIFDISKISAQGLSLGGIVGTTFSNYASTGLRDPASGTELPNVYGINASSLVAPAGGLAGAFAGSPTFGPVLFQTVTASDTFQALVDAANTGGYEPGSDEYTALVQEVYAGFIPTFAFAVQTAFDSADPINHAASLAATKLPVHVIEVVGDATNKPDQVLPNAVANFPLSGTEPLIANLGLKCVSSTNAGSGAVRFSKGHHSSIVSPNEIEGVTDGKAAAATVEMQQQVAAFALTAGKGTATILVQDSSVIQTCPE